MYRVSWTSELGRCSKWFKFEDWEPCHDLILELQKNGINPDVKRVDLDKLKDCTDQ